MAGMFGTDGVRGLANGDLTPELAFRLGRAAGTLLKTPGKRSTIVVGRDTRLSGTMLEGALAAGICSAGVDVYAAGVIPTPAIAYLVRNLETCAGAMISASHNPAPDNGIKFFNNEGFKLADSLEDKIEDLVQKDFVGLTRPTGKGLGRVITLADAEDSYINFLKGVTSTGLEGLKVVVDCANGASYRIAPRVLREKGAQVICLEDRPNGLNINESCGSTHPQLLQEAVIKFGADLGLAHDGDADRVIAVDEKGSIIDGDQILVICGLAMEQEGKLGGQLVVTVMSNLGLKKAFQEASINVLETKVGDRYVLEKMMETGAVLGGEQSGHVIFLNHNTTGDGILTALKLLEVMKKTGHSLSSLALQMEVFPQVLLNVRVKTKEGWEKNEAIQRALDEGQKALGNRGRLFVRASGTEPLIRVMAEGPEKVELDELTQRVARVVEEQLS